MKKFSKVILISLVGILGVFIAIMVGVNLWLQSGGVQIRLQETVENALRLSIRVRSTFYTPWSGVQLSGLTIPDNSTNQPGTFLEAQGFALSFDLLPLLKQRFVISQITLNNPVLTWRQSEGGKWRLPTISASPAKTPRDVSATPAARATASSTPIAQAPESSIRQASSNLPKFQVEIRKIRISQADGIFIDSQGNPFVGFKDLNIEATITPNRTVKGNFRVADLSFRDRLHIRRLRADFIEKDGTITSDNLRGHFADGMLEGRITVNMNGANPGFQTSMDLGNVRLPTLIEEAGFSSGRSSGTLSGSVQISGSLKSENDLAGNGHLEMVEGKVDPPDFIQQLGVLLRIQEFQTLILQKAYLNFTIREQKFAVDDLTLQSENTVLRLSGYARFNGKLNMKTRLAVNQEIQKQLRGLINDSFQPSTDFPGYKEMSFALTGRVSSPDTNDLWKKIVGNVSMGNVNQFIKGFFSSPQPSPSPSGPASN